MSRCAANTSPLVGLSSIGRLDLLREVFPRVWIPKAVFRETVADGAGWIQARQLQEELGNQDWLTVTDVPPSPLLNELADRLGGSGEAEAIALAVARNVPVLLDERAGRKAADEQGLSMIGSWGVLRIAKERGVVERLRPLVYGVVEAGIYYQHDLVERFLQEVGEA